VRGKITQLPPVATLPGRFHKAAWSKFMTYKDIKGFEWECSEPECHGEFVEALRNCNSWLAMVEMDMDMLNGGFSGQALILALGGVFLLYKATNEIHHKLDGENSHDNPEKKPKVSTMQQVITQIALINVVFSFDSILTGETIEENAKLQYLSAEIKTGNEFQRPELELFSAQKSQLQMQSELLTKTRNPKVFGFGQAGYGKPGLNMLSDDFDTYYSFGVGVKWKIHDWKKTKRDVQNIELKKELIETREDQFKRNIRLAVENYKQETEKLNKIMDIIVLKTIIE